MGILIGIGIFYFGFMLGFLVKAWLQARFRDYSGTIYVSKDDRAEKTVYSLVLDDYPEKLEFKKMVVFRVDTPPESQSKQGL